MFAKWVVHYGSGFSLIVILWYSKILFRTFCVYMFVESPFSSLARRKIKRCSSLSQRNLESEIRCEIVQSMPNFDKLVSLEECQTPHAHPNTNKNWTITFKSNKVLFHNLTVNQPCFITTYFTLKKSGSRAHQKSGLTGLIHCV